MSQVPEREKAASDYVAELKSKGEKEPIASFLNMRLLELSPGYAKVAMKIIPDYQNFNGFIFGGIIGAVADQAFAYGSNSLAFPSVASQFNLHFIAGAKVGDELIAECRVIQNGRKVGISEMTVTNQDGKLLAKATGTTIPLSAQKPAP
jgi:acyl-CoA thioesterase